MDRIATAIFGRQTTIQTILAHFQPHLDIALSISTSDPEVLLRAITQHRPQVVILEAIPDCFQLIGLVDQILVKHSETKCIVIARELDMLHVRQAVNAGVMGYMLIQPNFDDLITPVRLVYSGKFACSPEIVRRLVSSA